jgi:hypothetical protein
MRRQARLNLEKLKLDARALDADLYPGGVVCVRTAPLSAEFWTTPRIAAARQRIEAIVRERGVVYGFGSAVRGLDLLLVKVLRDRHATPTVFIPAPRRAFEDTWVGSGWRPFLTAVPADRTIVVPADGAAGDAFALSDDAAARAAADMARRLDEKPLLIAFPPPRATPDLRHVGEAIETWTGLHGGDVVVLEVP